MSATDDIVELKYHSESSSKESRQSINLKAGHPTHLELKGLSPNQSYSFSVAGTKSIVNGSFKTAKTVGKEFSFAIQADSHLDGNCDTNVYENTLKNMVADKSDFLVDLGDTFMVDKYPKYQDSDKQYQAQRYWFSIPGSNMPIYLCLGNHDGEVGWRARGGESTLDWSKTEREKYFPSAVSHKGLYYSWNWGDALCVVLDPFTFTTQKSRTGEDGWNWTLGETQFKWLEQTLKSSKAKFKFVFIHHLVGGLGREARGGIEAADRFEWGDEKEFPNKREKWTEPIHALMKKYHVSALFHGHDHLYVHQERDAIAYVEVPQPSQARGDNTNSAEEYGYKSGKILGSSGHLRVSIAGDTAKVEYVKSRLRGKNREVVDSFSIPASH